MSSPYDQLFDDRYLDTANRYAAHLLRHPEGSPDVHVTALAKTVCTLCRHIRAREELESLWIPLNDEIERSDL